MKVVNIGIIGLGTVGSGVVKLLNKNSSILKKELEWKLRLKKLLILI